MKEEGGPAVLFFCICATECLEVRIWPFCVQTMPEFQQNNATE